MKFLFYLLGTFACLILHSHTAHSQAFDGFTLYNNSNNSTTYLIDKNGDIAHTWSLPTNCNYTVLLKDNGNIVRGAVNNNNQINGAAVGGLVQEFDPQGNLVWGFTYSSANYVSHHDICIIGDNVLLTAWEVKSNAELQALGYTGNSSKYPTHFVEVQQDGTGGKIVWEWHMIDHVIQDVDASKPNYGVVADHPELMDINVPTSRGGGPGGGGGDWFHVNGVDYNPVLDQITFSSRFLSEVFIIDHSTTTAEAAGHTGGNSGKGGDILYRWGKPSNYDTPGAQTISGPCHDSRWIPNDGRPRGGYLHFFNNEGNGSVSTVDALELPFAADGYNYERTAGTAYGPTVASWRHTCLSNASGQSAANSMTNGNTFVNLSRGYQYEVDLNNNVVWQYNANPAKGFRYECDHPGVQALIAAGVVADTLCPTASNAIDDISIEQVVIAPNPSNGLFEITGLTGNHQIEAIQVFDLFGKRVMSLGHTPVIDLTDQLSGTYIVSIRLRSNQLISKKVAVIK